MIHPALLVAVVLLAATITLFFVWPYLMGLFKDPVPPGQYPLDEPRPEWTGRQRIRQYRPTPGMGSNVADSADVVGPKVDCMMGTASCGF